MMGQSHIAEQSRISRMIEGNSVYLENNSDR